MGTVHGIDLPSENLPGYDNTHFRLQGQEVALAYLINTYVQELEAFRFLEIGVWTGLTGQRLLERFLGLHYYGVDPFVPFEAQGAEIMRQVRDLARSRLWPLKNRALLVEKTSEEAWHSLSPELDYAVTFIDGLHDYASCSQDIELWWPRTTHVLAGHDYSGDGVRQAVHELAQRENRECFEIDRFNTWFIVKTERTDKGL